MTTFWSRHHSFVKFDVCAVAPSCLRTQTVGKEHWHMARSLGGPSSTFGCRYCPQQLSITVFFRKGTPDHNRHGKIRDWYCDPHFLSSIFECYGAGRRDTHRQ